MFVSRIHGAGQKQELSRKEFQGCGCHCDWRVRVDGGGVETGVLHSDPLLWVDILTLQILRTELVTGHFLSHRELFHPRWRLLSGSRLCPVTADVRTKWLAFLPQFGTSLMGLPNNRVSNRLAEAWLGPSYRWAPHLCSTWPSLFPQRALFYLIDLLLASPHPKVWLHRPPSWTRNIFPKDRSTVDFSKQDQSCWRGLELGAQGVSGRHSGFRRQDSCEAEALSIGKVH